MIKLSNQLFVTELVELLSSSYTGNPWRAFTNISPTGFARALAVSIVYYGKFNEFVSAFSDCTSTLSESQTQAMQKNGWLVI